MLVFFFLLLTDMAILVPERLRQRIPGRFVIRTFLSHAGAGERRGECMWSGALVYLVVLGWWRAVTRRLPDEPEHVIVLLAFCLNDR